MNEPHLYRAGTLVYTRPQLMALFFWLLWGDFCFMLMEAVIPSLLPLKLKDLGATNTMVGIILTSIPMLLNLANPVISFKSDRFRSRWGRRIPFLVFFMPLVVLSLLAVGYSDRLGFWFYHHFQSLLGQASPNTVALVAVGITMVLFSLFNILGTTSFWYLFNDVVPEHYMARFMAWFRMVSMGSAALYNYFVFRYADTHYTSIFIGAAVIYSFGFLLMCLKVKEGQYPPPSPYQKGGHGIKAAVQTYAKESLGMAHYWFVFLGSACFVSAFGVVGPFQIYLYRSTGMSLEQIGHIVGLGNLATACTMFITGWLADRFHPIRVVIAGLIVQILVVTPVSLIWFFAPPSPEHAYRFWILISVGLAAPAGALITMNDPPMFMRIFPRSRYGQYCSANALIRSLVMITAGVGVGVFLDQMKRLVGEERAYCLLPLWSGVLCFVMLVFVLLLFRSWKKHGGDEHYAAPLLDGGEESHDGPTPGAMH